MRNFKEYIEYIYSIEVKLYPLSDPICISKLVVIIVYSTSPPKKLFMILKDFLNGRNEKVVSLKGVEKRKGLLTRVEE